MIWSRYRTSAGVTTVHAFVGWDSLCRRVKAKAPPVEVNRAENAHHLCSDCVKWAATKAVKARSK